MSTTDPTQPTTPPDPLSAAVEAAAKGDATPKDERDLFDFFFQEGHLPGHEKPHNGVIDVGAGEEAREFPVQFRSLLWDEFTKNRDLAIEQGGGKLDEFVHASMNVAAVLITPNFQQRAEQLHEEARRNDGKVKFAGRMITKPKGAGGILRLIFEEEPGVLLDINSLVLRVSKLQASQSSARLADAPKG